MYSTPQQMEQAFATHAGFTQQDFIEAAQESTLFAVFKAEEYGISSATVTQWLNAARSTNQTQGV